MGQCNPCNHDDQIGMFPIGEKVFAKIADSIGGYQGMCVGHCADGRAVFDFGDDGIYTFHDERWLSRIFSERELKLAEALRFYSKREHYQVISGSFPTLDSAPLVSQDGGERARKALEELGIQP